jgi:hypothetical protein
MIGYKMRIVTTDETYEAPVTPKAAINFERHHKVGLVKALSQDMKMEHLYWLAWECTRSAGRVVKPFDGWLDEIQSVEFISPTAEAFEGKE